MSATRRACARCVAFERAGRGRKRRRTACAPQGPLQVCRQRLSGSTQPAQPSWRQASQTRAALQVSAAREAARLLSTAVSRLAGWACRALESGGAVEEYNRRAVPVAYAIQRLVQTSACAAQSADVASGAHELSPAASSELAALIARLDATTNNPGVRAAFGDASRNALFSSGAQQMHSGRLTAASTPGRPSTACSGQLRHGHWTQGRCAAGARQARRESLPHSAAASAVRPKYGDATVRLRILFLKEISRSSLPQVSACGSRVCLEHLAGHGMPRDWHSRTWPLTGFCLPAVIWRDVTATRTGMLGTLSRAFNCQSAMLRAVQDRLEQSRQHGGGHVWHTERQAARPQSAPMSRRTACKA